MAIEIDVDKTLLEIAQSAQRPAPERHRLTAVRAREFRQHLAPGLFHLPHPFVCRREHRLGRGEEGGSGTEFGNHPLQSFHLRERFEPGGVAAHLTGVAAEVLEAAGRCVGLE